LWMNALLCYLAYNNVISIPACLCIALCSQDDTEAKVKKYVAEYTNPVNVFIQEESKNDWVHKERSITFIHSFI
jgi:hypothetical protein